MLSHRHGKSIRNVNVGSEKRLFCVHPLHGTCITSEALQQRVLHIQYMQKLIDTISRSKSDKEHLALTDSHIEDTSI